MKRLLSNIPIPQGLADAVGRISGRLRVLVVGRPDTGKSTLALALAGWVAQTGRTCALVDCDVGQANAGPPGFVSYGLITKGGPGETELHDAGEESPHRDDSPSSLCFVSRRGSYLVGDVSPYGGGDGRLLAMVAGARLCLDAAEKEGADAVVVDTTGLAAFSEGLRLKCAKADAVRPDLIVLLGSSGDGNSAEAVLGDLFKSQGHNVLAVPAATEARRRTPDERRANRVRRWNRYLDRSSLRRVSTGRLRISWWWGDPGFVLRERGAYHTPRTVPHGTVVAVPDPLRKGLHVPGIWVTDEEGPGILADLPAEYQVETVWITSYQILMSRGRAMSG